MTAVTSDAVFRAFASFIFLSNISVMFTAYQVVNFVKVFNSTGHFQKQVFYTDPTVEWNSFILYALIIALIFIFISLIPSLLLCIYPTRLYRYLSRFLSARKQLAITAFAEALHSCFKDGLNGTRDYRAMAGGTLCIALLLSAIIYFSRKVIRGGTSRIVEIVSGADLGGGGGGGGGLWGCNPPKALETHREQCAGVKIYSTLGAQSTVQPERE